MNKNATRRLSALLPLAACILCACGDIESDDKSLTLLGPNEGALIEISPKEERRYIEAMHEQEQKIPEEKRYCVNDLGGDNVKISSYVDKYTACKGVKLELSFKHQGFGDDKVYAYHLATKSDFSNEIKFLSKETTYTVTSLRANATYYWKVSDLENKHTSPVKTFKTTSGWRGIDAGLTNNVRDLGGRKVKGGKVIKQGLLYRGCELNDHAYEANGANHNKTIDENTLRVFKNVMKVGTEIDFRGGDESGNITSSNLGWSVKYDRQPIGGYGSLVTDSSGKEDARVKAIFKDFLGAKEDASIYFHCMGGADRTGTIAFLAGGLLGMSYTDLIIDYELTSFSYNLREHDKLGQYSDFPSLIQGLKQVSGSTQENPDIQSMIETYLTQKVGLSTQEIDSFKNIMLEDNHE